MTNGWMDDDGNLMVMGNGELIDGDGCWHFVYFVFCVSLLALEI